MAIELLILILIGTSLIIKRRKLFFVLISILLTILMAYSIGNADMEAYQERYLFTFNTSAIFTQEPLFGLLMYICNRLNLSYTLFLIVVSCIGIYFLYKTYFKYSLCPEFAILMYLILFYEAFTIQIRCFIAEAIILYAIFSYVYDNDFGTIKYIIYIAIAELFQSTSVFFLIILLSKIINKRKMMIFVALFYFIPPILARYANRFGGVFFIKADIYLNNRRGLFNIKSLLFVIACIVLFAYIQRLAHKWEFVRGISDKDEKDIKKRQRSIADINIAGLIPLGLIVLYGNNFFRLNRPIILFDIVLLINYFYKRIIQRSNDRLKTAVLAGAIVQGVYISFEILTSNMYSFIMNNSILSKLL